MFRSGRFCVLVELLICFWLCSVFSRIELNFLKGLNTHLSEQKFACDGAEPQIVTIFMSGNETAGFSLSSCNGSIIERATSNCPAKNSLCDSKAAVFSIPSFLARAQKEVVSPFLQPIHFAPKANRLQTPSADSWTSLTLMWQMGRLFRKTLKIKTARQLICLDPAPKDCTRAEKHDFSLSQPKKGSVFSHCSIELFKQRWCLPSEVAQYICSAIAQLYPLLQNLTENKIKSFRPTQAITFWWHLTQISSWNSIEKSWNLC